MNHKFILAMLATACLAHAPHHHARAHLPDQRGAVRYATTLYDITTVWTTVTITAGVPAPSTEGNGINVSAADVAPASGEPAPSDSAPVANNPINAASEIAATSVSTAINAAAATSSVEKSTMAASQTARSSFVAVPPAHSDSAPPAAPQESAPAVASGPLQSGDVTWYATYNGLGRCGYYLSDTNNTCAVAATLFNGKSSIGVNEPAPGTPCNKKIDVYPEGVNGKSFQVIVADGCLGCSDSDLDLPQSFFEQNMPEQNGESPVQIGRYHSIQWQWAD